MDLEPFHRGVYGFLMLATSTISSALPVGNAQPSNLSPQNSIDITQQTINTHKSSFILSPATYNLTTNINKETAKLEFVGVAEKPVAPLVAQKEATNSSEVKAEIIAAEIVEESKEEKITEDTKDPEKIVAESKVEKTKTEESAKNPENKKPEGEVLAAVTPPSQPGSQNGDLLFQMTNDYRAKKGLPALEKDERVCKIAQARGPQLQNEIFGSGRMHAGFYALNLPYWATENIAGYQTEQQSFHFWTTDYIHRVAIEGDYKYSCVACYGNTCSQIFTNFAPK
jgi:uncharacterized protein YkwD